ncbi:MAG: polysaccharide biosynthesis protein, partial [Actinomycetota bacterium]|nr:polysaccharide biosynthesis protein [Actinomycetota bacterium]
PSEGLKTNVGGTTNVLMAASETGVERFINISTDKAADPVNVLGTTKRTAERITSHFDSISPGRYLSVRFGNVLGSNGSVIPTFMEQLNNGEPLTVTDPDVTRYFMTTEEAVLLVLQAATLAKGGDVLVLDMGEPVSIDALARRLSRQVVPGREPNIVYTGLRPGEKLHEVLVTTQDDLLEQPHPRLSRYAVPPMDPKVAAVADFVSGLTSDEPSTNEPIPSA